MEDNKNFIDTVTNQMIDNKIKTVNKPVFVCPTDPAELAQCDSCQ